MRQTRLMPGITLGPDHNRTFFILDNLSNEQWRNDGIKYVASGLSLRLSGEAELAHEVSTMGARANMEKEKLLLAPAEIPKP